MDWLYLFPLETLSMVPASVKPSIGKIDTTINYIVHHAWVKTGVFFVALLEATISPLLPEIVVGAILTYRKDISWKLLSAVSAVGSVVGVGILYAVGKFLYSTYQVFFDKIIGSGTVAQYAGSLLEGNAFLTLFVASFTPLPDRVFALLSGIYSLPIVVVAVAFFLGRLIRVGIVAYFSYHFGDEAREYILRNTKKATGIIVGIVIIYILLRVSGIL